MRMRFLAIAALFPLAAIAGQHIDYATEWPLSLSRDDGGAYRVMLTPEIYAAAQDPMLADIQVFNAAGVAMPTALLGPEAPLARSDAVQEVSLRWFPLPVPTGTDEAAAWEMHTQRDARGRVSRVDVTVRDAAAPAPRPGSAMLLDLSQIREPIAALHFEWQIPTEPFNTEFSLEESDDLTHWRRLRDNYTLAELVDGRSESQRGGSLRRDTMRINRRSAPFLRLTPLQGDAHIAITSIRAELPQAPAAPQWEWIDLDGRSVVEQKRTYYEYTLPARVPVQQLDVIAASANSAVEWNVRSRENERAVWQFRAGPWMGYQVSAGGHDEHSIPQSLVTATRDRIWRVEAAQPVAQTPHLRLGYRPEVLVFLAQGDGPYSVAAGSARARRIDAPLPALIADLRTQRRDDWQPYPAYPDVAKVLAGSAALTPAPIPPKPVDWKSWLLWGLLVGATLIVGGMALSLLKPGISGKDENAG
ncbi:MAG: DUF3999 domain-containing protein [Tahibacter sp.]